MGVQPSTKRGQIHINETILVLFVVIIIILIGIVVYYKFSIQSVETLGEDLSERDASILLVKATSLHEISCDHYDCLDTSKFIPFQDLVEEDRHYRTALGKKKITIHQVYPVPPEGTCDISKYIQFEYPDNCQEWVLYEHNPEQERPRIVSTTVSLYFPETNTYRIGRLIIEHYGSI